MMLGFPQIRVEDTVIGHRIFDVSCDTVAQVSPHVGDSQYMSRWISVFTPSYIDRLDLRLGFMTVHSFRPRGP